MNMRQQNDMSSSQMLNRIRKGEQTHKDVKAIKGRLVSNGDIDLSAAPFDTALRLYPCTASVDEYNESQIASLAQTTKLYMFEAEHAILQSGGQFYANMQYNEVIERLIPQDDKECAALPCRLKLAVGARVMLRTTSTVVMGWSMELGDKLLASGGLEMPAIRVNLASFQWRFM